MAAELYPDPLGKLKRSPDPLAAMGGPTSKGKGGEGRAPKLLLNQGPLEICYATASHSSIMYVGYYEHKSVQWTFVMVSESQRGHARKRRAESTVDSVRVTA